MTGTAFVHAKRHSERCPGKNLRMLGDRPLFCHAIRIGLEAKLVDRVVIDSEDDEILRIGEEHGAMPLKRPMELATNEATGDDLAYWQAQHAMADEAMVQIVPTSPFILPATIDDILTRFEDWGVNTVIGASCTHIYRWRQIVCPLPPVRSFDGLTLAAPEYRTQPPLPSSVALEPTWWETTGLYAMRPDVVCRIRRRIDYRCCGLLLLSNIETIDIDTEDDFRFAEIIWRGLHTGLQT